MVVAVGRAATALPIKDADRLVVPGTITKFGQTTGLSHGFTYTFFPVIRDSGIFERVAAEWSSPLSLLTATTEGSLPVRTTVGFATSDLFDLPNTIRAFLFQVQPFDPLTLAAVAATILTLALVVSVRRHCAQRESTLGRS